ncbi:MAG: response regulator, partial [Zetaproteobacteria bacterium]|nr:response regulator [Zetaproteobacteria bacterium]
GYDVLNVMRASPKLKSLPVVMISTTENKIEVEKALRMGANSFIVKPVSPQNYHQAIVQVQGMPKRQR